MSVLVAAVVAPAIQPVALTAELRARLEYIKASSFGAHAALGQQVLAHLNSSHPRGPKQAPPESRIL